MSEIEIKNAIFSIHDAKASGSDGYTANFFKSTWSITWPLLTHAVSEFFTFERLLRQWNTTLVAMIPKSGHAHAVGDFRPIACGNVIYKVISKILFNRLIPILDGIVDKSQSAFIQGRLI